MNRFNNKPTFGNNDFENLAEGTYDAILEAAVLDDVAVWENGSDTGKKTTGIKLTFRITQDEGKNRKQWKTLKFNSDKEFEKASEQLVHLGVWDEASKAGDETACIEKAAHLLYGLVEKAQVVLYVGEFNNRNYCKVQKLRETTVAGPTAGLTNHAPVMDASEEIPF